MKTISFILLLTIIISTIVAEDDVVLSPDYTTKDYSFTGIVSTVMGGFKSSHSFKGFVKKDVIECSWTNDAGIIKMNGLVKADSNGGTLTIDGVANMTYDSPLMAIAAATGVSGGSAHLMYSLRTGDVKSILPGEHVKISRNGSLIEITGLSQDSSRSTTVIVNNGYLVSVDSIFDPLAAKQKPLVDEITDQSLNDILKAQGKEQTKAEMDKIRETMKSANEAMSKIKDKIITKTTVSINDLYPMAEK